MKTLLEVGISPDGELFTVDEVEKGKTHLLCPFCKGPLVAKKGLIKQHHFAHLDETCNASTSLKPLPAFDDFTLKLEPAEYEALLSLWDSSQQGRKGIVQPKRSLITKGMFQENIFRSGGSYEFTKLGKIPVKDLSVNLFSQLHPQLLLEMHEQMVADSGKEGLLKVSLDVYRAQLRRLFKAHLYLLEIQTADETFYKIGLTTRTIEERLQEIMRDLAEHFEAIEIKVLSFKEHRGHCERYFKYKYSEHNKPIGHLTEYFEFDSGTAKKVIADIRRIPKREFDKTEQRIITNWWAKEEKRLVAVRRGMSLAKAIGQTNLGRPEGSKEPIEKYLSKPKNVRIAELLGHGHSIRKVASLAEASEKTVQRVKRELAKLSSS